MRKWIPLQIGDLAVLNQKRIERHFYQVPDPDAFRGRQALHGGEARVVRNFDLRDSTPGHLTNAHAWCLVLQRCARHIIRPLQGLVEDALLAILLLVYVEDVRGVHFC